MSLDKEEMGFEKNLDVIENDINLFGEEVPRYAVLERIGFLPISVWKPDWEKVRKMKEWVGDAGQSRELQGRKMQLLGSKYTTSIFNPHLAQMILSAYCPQGAVIFDPFAGGGTRGFVAGAMSHKYFGIEIRENEVERLKTRMEELNTYFDIVCGDSRNFEVQSEAYDFCYTCPPYYDLEVYSSIDGDMSNVQSYEEFLSMLKDSVKTAYNALKKDSLAIWIVGNFRDKHGYLRHFNGDFVRIAKEVGFNLHDELIFWGASDAAFQRSGQFVANRKSVRVHEYIIILKK